MDGDSLKIMNALLFGARSHPIDGIRNAKMAAGFGPQESPDDVCTAIRTAALSGSPAGWSDGEKRSCGADVAASCAGGGEAVRGVEGLRGMPQPHLFGIPENSNGSFRAARIGGYTRLFPATRLRPVAEMNWRSLTNGRLLKEASGHFDLLITLDQDLIFQNPAGKRGLGAIVLVTRLNSVATYRPHFAKIRDLARQTKPG